MLRELAHFVRHAPATLRLKARLSQADLYHALMSRAEPAGLADQRAHLAAGLAGELLEVGAGTGLMFPHYPADASVIAIEPDAAFAALAGTTATQARARIVVQVADGQALPFAGARFDTVVVSLVLCSVPDVAGVLREIRRVLRPGGELRLIEHVRSDRVVPGLLMNAFNGLWLRLNQQGCNMNRRPLQALRAAGFELIEVIPFQLWSPGLPAFPMRRIRARATP